MIPVSVLNTMTSDLFLGCQGPVAFVPIGSSWRGVPSLGFAVGRTEFGRFVTDTLLALLSALNPSVGRSFLIADFYWEMIAFALTCMTIQLTLY